MWAAAAIGISHLVQSTRAGATAGFALAGIILAALILKYPFFEYGHRYAAATGWSLVEGYRRIGRWALWLYFGLTLVTAVIHQVAILLFTSFLIRYLLGLDWSAAVIGGLLYAGCTTLLLAGRFQVFDRTVKAVLVFLALSTVAATAIALPRADFSTLALWPLMHVDAVIPFAFILALVGFMPSAVEISVMSSLWVLAKDRASGERTSVKMVQLDFNVGYVGTGILAFAFLALGTAVMHGAGQEFSPQGTVFSTQLVELYTRTLGDWTRVLVGVAAFATMFSTALIVIDGFPRAIDRCFQNLRAGAPYPEPDAPTGRGYWIVLIVFGVLNILALALFAGNLTTMIDFATIFTFAVTPVLGYLNLKAVTSSDMPVEHRPGRGMLALTYVGLVVLGVTTLVYLVSRFG
jgi:Mn2+/Fe2+ NRAMP family transporter